MKRPIQSIMAGLMTAAMLLPPVAATSAGAETSAGDESGITVVYTRNETVFCEDHRDVTLTELTAGNDTVHTYNGQTPLNNLYDLHIVGEGYTPFTTFDTASKNLNLLGNHAVENVSKNVFVLDNNDDRTAGKGVITVIPASAMEGLESFTLSWITRVHRPKSGYAGLALFYDNATTVDGVDYFGGYDRYTYVGFTGDMMNSFAAYSVYGGETVTFAAAEMQTKREEINTSIYASVTCTKGTFTYEGVTYTAKLESYVDDQLVCTSYAQWADAPVLFFYESDSARWSVQFTDLTLKADVTHTVTAEEWVAAEQPLSVTGTAVRYVGGAGLRFYTELEKDELYAMASRVETGMLLLDAQAYATGQALFVDTEGVLRSEAPVVLTDDEALLETTHDFTDPALEGGSFVARGYAVYEIDGQTVYAYTPVEQASCARTAAKVIGKFERTDETAAMLDACTAISGNATTLNVMTLNMLVPGTSSDQNTEKYGTLQYTERLEAMVDMLLTLKPDVVGLQEVSTALQMSVLKNDRDLRAMYGFVGSDDDTLQSGGSGEEGLYILYNKDRFELVSSGCKYLSDTPDVPHSLFAEAAAHNSAEGTTKLYYPRKVVYAVLRDKTSGQSFAFCTTHLCYNAGESSVTKIIRRKQVDTIFELIAGGDMFDPSLPYILLGDMNAGPGSDAYEAFLTETDDLRYVADKAPAADQGTLHKFGTSTNSFLDHIFISRNDFYPTESRIVTEEYACASLGKSILPSDHYAVMGTVTVLPE